jgi:hypothetical protein
LRGCLSIRPAGRGRFWRPREEMHMDEVCSPMEMLAFGLFSGCHSSIGCLDTPSMQLADISRVLVGFTRVGKCSEQNRHLLATQIPCSTTKTQWCIEYPGDLGLEETRTGFRHDVIFPFMPRSNRYHEREICPEIDLYHGENKSCTLSFAPYIFDLIFLGSLAISQY